MVVGSTGSDRVTKLVNKMGHGGALGRERGAADDQLHRFSSPFHGSRLE